jgi:hypothetical protein
VTAVVPKPTAVVTPIIELTFTIFGAAIVVSFFSIYD